MTHTYPSEQIEQQTLREHEKRKGVQENITSSSLNRTEDSLESGFLLDILQEIESVLRRVDASAVKSLIEYLQKADHIFLAGKGRSGFMARCFAMRLMHAGLQAYVVGETTTPAMQKQDLLILCSASGETAETCLTAEKGNKIGTPVIAITTNTQSRLAQAATLVIHLPASHKNTTHGSSIQFAGALFEQSLLLFFDAVFLQATRLWQVDVGFLQARHANLE